MEYSINGYTVPLLFTTLGPWESEPLELKSEECQLAYPASAASSNESIFTFALSASRLINAVSVGITASVLSILTLVYVYTTIAVLYASKIEHLLKDSKRVEILSADSVEAMGAIHLPTAKTLWGRCPKLPSQDTVKM